jgi:hypothetical protein
MKSKFVMLTTLAVLCGMQVFSQVFEQTRSIRKTFPIGAQTSLKISNKYGNLMFMTWDKDSVGFEVIIKVSDHREGDAINRLALIDVKFTANPFFVDATTVFNNEKNNLGADIAEKITNGIFNSEPIVWIILFIYRWTCRWNW